ncbi:hypothetical protein SAMN05216420_11637 [Nitrosospira sp. Nl5]|uniref:hypothetical protein n=1 Tax=Nitrosospira sp. Nl5 TaxID=200120 RepID=UPI00087F4906|nr:hypothetical protein [Nitrosospira sp. Nl5]SCY74883.1 hypothetical protein SAMN05216420_11637 [Nitrosospira sp. Nl5]
MKPTLKSIARAVGNRKLTFALISRSHKLRKKMTNKSAIDTLLQNFLLDAEQPMEQVTAALSVMAADKSFEALGHAAFTAMLKAHTARLGSSKATLTAKAPRRNIH